MNDDRRSRLVPDPGKEDAVNLDHYSDDFRRAWETAAMNEPGATALDPNLWETIRERHQSDGKTSGRRRPRISQRSPLQYEKSADVSGIPDVPPAAPGTPWPRGLLVVTGVLLVALIVMWMPGGRVDPQQGAVVRDASIVLSPSSLLAQGCDVEPLTRDQVLAMVLDPEQQGFRDDRELFATPPPVLNSYPHTRTWLPDSSGLVEMAGGQRPVRLPTSSEFEGARSALDRYLRCQVEGTNYQLWALESPREVQRQVLVLTAALNGGQGGIDGANVAESVTETALLETIDEVGPEFRSSGEYSIYMFFHEELGGFVVRPNPNPSESLIAENPETGEVEYAWIATERVDPDSETVISSRGASLDSTPQSEDGTIPNLVVMILRYDAEVERWLVEWFVPTI